MYIRTLFKLLKLIFGNVLEHCLTPFTYFTPFTPLASFGTFKMGHSFTVVEKDFLTLSVDVDRDITIELSSGWLTSQHKAAVSAQIKLTYKELEEAIAELIKIKEELRDHKTCDSCGSINRRDSIKCQTCEDLL